MGASSNWNARGIVGRGVLVDFYSWARKNGIEYDPLTDYAIDLDHVKKIISENNITLQQGDILFLRTGKHRTDIYHPRRIDAFAYVLVISRVRRRILTAGCLWV